MRTLRSMRVLILVDGFHTEELIASLTRLLNLDRAELLLLYVQGPGPRAGLDLVRSRPGGHRLPPHRDRELTQAELERRANALAEAEKLAQPLSSNVESIKLGASQVARSATSHRNGASISSSCELAAAINRGWAQGRSDQLPASSLTTAPARSSFCAGLSSRRAWPRPPVERSGVWIFLH
jgi:hypothetical protein